MVTMWPEAPDGRQLRRFAVSWCLVPPAETLLRHPGGPAALALVVRRSGGTVQGEIASWSGEIPADSSASCFRRCDEAHSLLHELYGSDPLGDLGPAASAFLACVPDGRSSGIVATAIRSDDGVRTRLVEPSIEREAMVLGLAGDALEVFRRHRALQGLNDIALALRLVRGYTSDHRPAAWAQFDAVMDGLARTWQFTPPHSES